MPLLAALFAHPGFVSLSRSSCFGFPGDVLSASASRMHWWTANLGSITPGAASVAQLLECTVRPVALLPAVVSGNAELAEDVATVLSAPGFLKLERVRGEGGQADTWVVESAVAQGVQSTRCSGYSPWEAVVVAACALLRVDLMGVRNPPSALGVDFALAHGGVDALRLLLASAPSLGVLCSRLREISEREDMSDMASLLKMIGLSGATSALTRARQDSAILEQAREAMRPLGEPDAEHDGETLAELHRILFPGARSGTR